MALVSTIMQSTADEYSEEIAQDYFITNDQKVNKKSKLDGGNYLSKMKRAIVHEINDSLKGMMILKSHHIGLYVVNKNTTEFRIVQTFGDIGLR